MQGLVRRALPAEIITQHFLGSGKALGGSAGQFDAEQEGDVGIRGRFSFSLNFKKGETLRKVIQFWSNTKKRSRECIMNPIPWLKKKIDH